MMQKSTTFTRILRVKKCYFQYDFACKKVPLSLRYARIVIYTISGIKAILQDSSVKIADNEGVSPSSSVITRVIR
jgi:hypothetical protein